ncbi:uncharacterized protein MONOS_15843 [Monocercomonoides exilis]|uniref:uncharacterized protein n=1 Tax=Monocercomonoides exilis TaxID=2049356 RepID=UPI003559413B|nr:hypothetical protein MONOS_15843 [Monocercomonoides exilis]|eukprot:MONOS_15843.1-p1 / transcript=MONOS_15843.1 / gene=MONOS_15843 / organism=Monocercomonoides_exilis_PA203 / gene_product=unspecified product / transcript_product=unspecified product / location=Mono_scaffold01376:1452-8390(-) / protein_length=2312 / sequence_SO=supercontig / SO=protein_coding / is_pseudo=false
MSPSGIFYCVWIISVGSVCNVATSDGAGFGEKSAKEGELDYPEGTWREKAQNNKIGVGHLFDTYIEEKEGEMGKIWKEERIMKKCTKQWNGRSGEIGKVEKWGFCDECKMWGKEGVCGGSRVEGSVVVVNSSMRLNSLGLMDKGGESVIKAEEVCFVELIGCVVGIEKETPPFDFCESYGLFTNISLRSSSTSTSTEQIFPPLFFSKAVEGEISEKCHVSVCSSHFSSFCVSSAPFLSSPSIPLISISHLTFFNISTANDACSPSTTMSTQTSCFIFSCSFSSVCDAYDGGIVPSLNNPLASFSASNTSFIGCCRTRNVVCEGKADGKLTPGRQNTTDKGANSFTWCEWNGSRTTGESDSASDGKSSGGAICMHNLGSGTLLVKYCSFNDCCAYWDGGGIMCVSINSIKIENNSFNACTAKNNYGGGMCAYDITSCVRISGCEFQKCKADRIGGGLYLDNFNISGSTCIGTESGKGESACVFECSFTSCSLTSNCGGGMFCQNVPAAFKMRSIQFISCSAKSTGGGIDFRSKQQIAPSNNIYCYYFFFYDCSCISSIPHGQDVYFQDYYNLFSSNNPFYESYSTNSNDRRVCYEYLQSGNWYFQEAEKKWWLSDGMKDRYVDINGDDSNEWCITNESTTCKTIGFAVNMSSQQLFSSISVLGGKHVSEGATIGVGEKKISVVGKGKTVSVIGTSALSTSSPTLFSLSSGQLEVGHVGIDHNATRSSSPSVFVVSLGSGTLSLEDVVIDSSTSGGSGMTKCVFEVALRQLKTIDVEIRNIKISQPLFAEPSSAGSSSGESVLGNLTIRNVNRTGGDGVAMSKSVKAGETFVVWNTTMEGCECANGNGGGIKVELEGASSKVLIGDSTSLSGGTTTFKQSKCSGCGGGMFLTLAEAGAKFELSDTLVFERNEAEYGKNMFILATDLNKSVTNDSLNFDYSSIVNDKTLFVGSDSYHSNKDLFMFLVPFSSFEIFISSKGFDVARCGSEEEPCKTIWKGMKNMKKESGMKTIQIEGSTIIRDSFNVSNYWIKKSVKMGEEETKAKLNFEKSIGSQLEYFMVNDIHLELTNMKLQLTSGFDNSAKTIISNRGGDLVITGCSFHSEAGVNNGFDCVFVDAAGGSVEVNGLSMESCNVGNSIYTIHDSGVSCRLVNVRVESLNESGGCILSIKKSEPGSKLKNKNEKINLQIEKSSFSGVKRSDNGASILESKSEKRICLVVNSSNITEDKAEMSEKGGAIFFTLGASGSLKMIDSTISHCSCSLSSGKGGGVYMTTKETGFLNFTFIGMKFNNNTASVGNDIFIECFNISSQINESQFQFDLRENHYSRINAIYGIDRCDYKSDTNLIEFVTFHQSDTIIVSSISGSNEKKCGTNVLPCFSIDYGLAHLTSDILSLIFVVEESVIGGEIDLKEMSLSSKSREMCEVEVKSEIEKRKDALVTTAGTVSLMRVNFVFDSDFISSHESLISPEGGIIEMMNCSFTTKQSNEEGNEFASIPFHIMNMEKGELQLDGCSLSNLILHKSSIYLSSTSPSIIDSLTICDSTVSKSLIDINECGQLTIKDFNAENVSVEGNEESLISCSSMKKTMQLENCTMGGIGSKTSKGKLMKLEDCTEVKMDSCIFDGSSNERNEKNTNTEEEICKWDGSLADITKSSVVMKDTTLSNSPDGGITMSGGELTVNDGRFENNNPSIEGYTSLRRNIICSDSGTLIVMSLKGGDGWKDNTSLWMLNEGCSFEGIVSERDSSFFIPVLESAEAKEEANRMKMTFKGLLLVPCNLSFSVVKRKGDEIEIEHYDFDLNGFLSEREVEGSVGKHLISSCGDEIEVSACILFGNEESSSSTNLFILKNASEAKTNGNERIVEGGKEGKSYWLLIVIVLVVILLIVLIVSIIVTIRWRKQKRRTKELEIIVEDNIKKDPKLIEMMTMEMSPEEQWRRAEREAEKKNEEKIKKRVYAKSLGHSESSEHLLSESGSTEYILGRDSDNIPEWMLEKVDGKEEEEEARKRSPSPSISSTSTTDTTDSDSTFVRGEDLCPTTSSMSNLVDAMACSSPHEKLIVDLRDSLFMLLHGRNEKKEMAIGSLQQREQTAAQILFWVANGALHSFDEMENTLSSLSNLSPHIVLFSEHMVIAIAMHSDCSSDDSDSSSISLSTVVTSASDDDDDESDSLPSSAFEDEEDNRYECLRWKAPELLMNKKIGATKESVVFSIGMMLWECLTLQIPFGEYEAEMAGKKILNGERPTHQGLGECSLKEAICKCWQGEVNERMSLMNIKKELIQQFPPGAVIMTISDTIDFDESEDNEKENKLMSCRKPSVICKCN